MNKFIYFDNNATTRMDDKVVQAMLPFLTEFYTNPSALYAASSIPKKAIEQARIDVATLVNATPSEIIFTGCGTEADNTAIHSAIECYPNKRHIVISACEHPAVTKFVEYLEKKGYFVTRLLPTKDGIISPQTVAQVIRPDTALVSVMAANNETGVINPIYHIGDIVKKAGVLYHVDATQAIGKIPIDFRRTNADYMAFSAHKYHGPKGVGVLVVRKGTCYAPLLRGGGQENDCRAGTENVAGIVGTGMASRLAYEGLPLMADIQAMRDMIQHQIKLMFGPNVIILGESVPRTPNTLMVALKNINARTLQDALSNNGIMVGVGSACSCLKNPKPSPTVVAMGVPKDYQLGTLRISLSRFNLPKEKALQDVSHLLSTLSQL